MPTQIAQFLSQPFSANMSAARWFLFVGLLVAALVSWRMIYREFTAVEPEL